MALDMQPGAELGHTGVDADASAPVAPGDDASPASPAVCAAYERAMRIATLLVGDQALAADAVAEALSSVRADQRRRALRLAPGPELLRPLVLRAQEIDDELTHGEPIAPPPLVRTSTADDVDDPFHAISHRDLRWALLALPMRDRAIVVLGALTDLDESDLQRVLVLDGGEVAAAASAARALLLDMVQVEADPDQLHTAIGRAAADLTIAVEPDALAELLRHERSWWERLGRPQLTRWGIVAALLVGALVWLTTRDARPPKVVVTPPPSNLVRPTSTAPAPVPSSVPTSTPSADAVGLRTTVTGSVAPTSTAATSATTASAAVEVDAATEELVTDTTARPVTTAAPATTVTPPVPTAAPDTVAPTAPATTSAPPATTTATTAAPPATTAPPTRPPATTAAPPATTAAPPTTAAPTTTVAPTRLAISATTCRRTWFDVTFTVSGVTSPANPSVTLATPWGTYSAAAIGQGATATWTVQVTASAWFPGPGPYGVTANAGGQQASASMTCG